MPQSLRIEASRASGPLDQELQEHPRSICPPRPVHLLRRSQRSRQEGVGKSNLFDAIHFLSALAERDISEAASDVRRTSDGGYSPLDLVFGRDPSRKIELSVQMVVSPEVKDDFDESAKPSTTLLTYTVRLLYESESDRLFVENESLTHAKLGNYKKFIGFSSSPKFRSSVASGSRRGGPLISTDGDRIMLHGDGGSRGRPAPVGRSPRTVVGGTNTFDYPTVLGAKREMFILAGTAP